eukprot:9092794-Ditylum_brightwellii.AAC.1
MGSSHRHLVASAGKLCVAFVQNVIGNLAAENDWEKHEQSLSEGEIRTTRSELLQAEMYPKRHYFHKMFIFINFITIVIAILYGIGQFIGIAFEQVGPVQYVLRVYVIALSALVILNELELSSLTSTSKLLNMWITRGLTYAFIGVLGLEENGGVVQVQEGADTEMRDMGILFIKVVAWMMVGIGCLYFVMGCLCLQIVLNKMREDYQFRVQRGKEKRKEVKRNPQLFANLGDMA